MSADQANEEQGVDLSAVLARIPERWGRWVRTGPGWHALIVGLDAKLAEVDPGYELHQVKSKFGGLRYYIQNTTETESCCAVLGEGREDELLSEQGDWYEHTYLPHLSSKEHAREEERVETANQARYETSAKIIAEYEKACESICEQCGQAGTLREGAWIEVLCDACAGAQA